MSLTTKIQRHRIFIRIRWFIYVRSEKGLLSLFTFYMTAPPIYTGETPRLCVAELNTWQPAICSIYVLFFKIKLIYIMITGKKSRWLVFGTELCFLICFSLVCNVIEQIHVLCQLSHWGFPLRSNMILM